MSLAHHLPSPPLLSSRQIDSSPSADPPTLHPFLRTLTPILPLHTQVESLQRRIAPHLLRRVKEDVAKDIPPKEETIIDVELTTMQKQYYRYALHCAVLCCVCCACCVFSERFYNFTVLRMQQEYLTALYTQHPDHLNNHPVAPSSMP